MSRRRKHHRASRSSNDFLPHDPWPVKNLSLTGPDGPATIRMEQKYGVWMIMEASGAFRTNDFHHKNGWGITQPALDRCLRHTGYSLTNTTSQPGPPFPGQKSPVNVL